MAIDPVCKMQVDEKTAQFKSIYKGASYFFCSKSCKRSFDENPEEFLSGDPEKKPRPCCGQ